MIELLDYTAVSGPAFRINKIIRLFTDTVGERLKGTGKQQLTVTFYFASGPHKV